MGTNLIKGINNKIKVMKCMAYGSRDEVYLFKIGGFSRNSVKNLFCVQRPVYRRSPPGHLSLPKIKACAYSAAQDDVQR